MSSLASETVTEVHHWTDTLFSFKTTRDPGFRFHNGHFTMMGLPQEDSRPLLRAYSIVSANYEDHLEFFSIKVPNGPLTSILQHIKPGDEILINRKSTGTLVTGNLRPGKTLWMLSTGTGLAPFMSIIKDPEIYEQYDKVVLTHGVRYKNELAYQAFIEQELPNNDFFGEMVRDKLVYFPTVTREEYRNQGRLTDLLKSGELSKKLDLPPIDPAQDRFMICGSPAMLKQSCEILDEFGLSETRNRHIGEYVIERAFVES